MRKRQLKIISLCTLAAVCSLTFNDVQAFTLNNKIEKQMVSTKTSNLEGKEYKRNEFIIKFKETKFRSASERRIKDEVVTMVEDSNLRFKSTEKIDENIMGNLLQLVKYEGNKDLEVIIDEIYEENKDIIEYIEPNYIISTEYDVNDNKDIKNIMANKNLNSRWMPQDPYYANLWGLRNNINYDIDINVEPAWDITRGSSDVVVAVLDGGVDISHPDLKDNIYVNTAEIPNNGIDDDGNGYIDDVNGWNFYDDNNDPSDTGIHGTHVAGTIAAASNTIGVVGVAPNVKILPLRFSDPVYGGGTSDAIKAISYAAKMGAEIINHSWIIRNYSQALYDVIKETNILNVCGAGNSSGNSDTDPLYPAAYDLPNIISVAALNQDGSLRHSSNYGSTTVDLAAPGEVIQSTIPGGQYEFASGTSMAAPHVTGVAALLKSKNSNYTNEEIKEAILSTVKPLNSLNGRVATGGLLNAYGALTYGEEIEEVTKGNLKVAIDIAEEITEADLSKVSQEIANEFRIALKMAIGVFEKPNALQTEVNTATDNLNEAINKVKGIVVGNKEVLIGLRDTVKLLNKNDFIPSTWNKLQEALAEANTIIDNVNASQKVIDEAYNKLNSAYLALVAKPDKSNLEELINSANSLDESKYTEESYANVVKALEAAETVFNDEEATGEDINTSFDRLNEAIQMLEFKKVDKTQLIALAERIEALDSSKYIKTTWNKLAIVLEATNKVIADTNAMEEEVAESYNSLLKSFLQLRLKPSKDVLEDLINKAKKLNPVNYTKASWKVVENALEEANKILTNENSTEKEIKKAEENLKVAMSNLKESTITNNQENTTNNIASSNGNNSSKNQGGKLPNTGGRSAGVIGTFGLMIFTAGATLFRGKKRN